MLSSRTPEDVCALLEGWPHNWWVAGGYALELFTGSNTRPHSDLDISILKQDDTSLRQYLGNMTFWADVGNSTPSNLPLRAGEKPPDPPRVMWCRHGLDGEWWFDLFTESHNTNEWIFKRTGTITKPLGDMGLRTPDGIPYIAPEIVLLHKAKNNRPKDLTDFYTTLPFLDESRRQWLKTAIAKVHPDHFWLSQL